jgi:hypothetical protein
MDQLNSDLISNTSTTQIHPSDDQLAMSNRHHYYTLEVRNRLSRIRTPTTQDEEKLRLHTKATFHFERNEVEYFEAVERGEYEGDTIMDEIVAWEKRENMEVNWGRNESKGVRGKKKGNEMLETDDLNGQGTAEDPIVLD